jgi:hypothetical protein
MYKKPGNKINMGNSKLGRRHPIAFKHGYVKAFSRSPGLLSGREVCLKKTVHGGQGRQSK